MVKNTISDEQKNIIQDLESCFVEAMAGSGKTTTLVKKIEALLDNNKSWKKLHILLLLKKQQKKAKKD